MKKELYLFILWANSRFMEKQIANDLKKRYEIFRIYEIQWQPQNIELNLMRFYGKRLHYGCKKEKEIGTGSFKVYLIHDNNPQYLNGKNINIVKSKAQYRQLTGGGHLVHASDNIEETNENLLFLFGKGIRDFESEISDSTVHMYKHDLVGIPNWNNVQEALDIAHKIPYTHIKAYKNTYLIHSKNADTIRRLLNAQSCFCIPGIHKYTIKIGKQKQPIYIRQIS